VISPANQNPLADSAFDLSNSAAYAHWRQQKLLLKTPDIADLMVDVENPHQLTAAEKSAIVERCQHYNMAIYQLPASASNDKSLVHALGAQLSMTRLDTNLRADGDSVTSLQVRAQSGNQYIPYTNKALSWHTDGYYNAIDKQIYAIIMHCVQPAESGGVNRLLSPEQLYIRLRDENPAYIEALMHPQAMIIPDNIENGQVIRAAQSGPVFSVKPSVGIEAGRLHMRYSARKRNIIWRDTADTSKAVEMMIEIMADDANVQKVTLQAGQGIICNNALHNRSSFIDSDEQKRLMYRARYYDAVASNE
jgi:hypothetical protein